MSILYTNNAEGGVDGIAANTSNTGESSGTAFPYQFTNGAGTSITFSSLQKRGDLSYRFITTTTAAQIYFEWTTLPNIPTIYARFTLFLPVIPATSIRPIEINDGANVCISLGIRPDGKLSFRDHLAAQMAVSALPLPAGRWIRIELSVVSSATVGQMTCRMYTEVDSPYPAEQIVSPATFNTRPSTGYFNKVRFGMISFNVTNMEYYLDDLAVADAGWLGPANQSQMPSLAYTNNAGMGASGTIVTSENSGDASNNFFEHITNIGAISFSSAQKSHGSLSYFVQPTSGNTAQMTWKTLSCSSGAMRLYVYLTGYPPGSTEIAQFTTTDFNTTFRTLARYTLSSSGRLGIMDGSNTTLWTATSPMSLNTWYRIEMLATQGSSDATGTINAAYYLLDNLTAIQSFSTSTATLGTSVVPFSFFRTGKLNADSWTSPFYLDCIAVQQGANSFIGPYTGPQIPPNTYAGVIPHLGWGRHI